MGRFRPVAAVTALSAAQRGVGELGLGEVVRHVDGEAERVVAGLAEPQLEQRGQAARHLDACRRRLSCCGDQPRVGGVRGHARSAGCAAPPSGCRGR